jgi:hypothetical protein
MPLKLAVQEDIRYARVAPLPPPTTLGINSPLTYATPPHARTSEVTTGGREGGGISSLLSSQTSVYCWTTKEKEFPTNTVIFVSRIFR